MATPTWLTKAGFLATLTERTPADVPFAVSGTDSQFSIISGSLPDGMVLLAETSATTTSTIGYITGNPTSVPAPITSTFVIRAKNDQGVSDQTFTLDTVGGVAPLWLTPSGFLHVGTSGECFAVNKHIIDYQMSAIPNVLFENMKLRYYIAEGDGQLPLGLTIDEDGRITGTIDEITVIEGSDSASSAGYDNEKYDKYPYDGAVIINSVTTKPTYIKKIYQFYVTATDGFNSTRKMFKMQVVDVNSLRSDTSYISADAGCFQAGNSYLYAPIWLSPANLGIRRANNYQIVTLKTYEPFPELGSSRWDWDIVSVNPEIKAFADSELEVGPYGTNYNIRGSVLNYVDLPFDAVQGDVFTVREDETFLNETRSYIWIGTSWEFVSFYPKYNRTGTSTIHVKNLTSLPTAGQQFRLDSYIDTVFTTTYTITSVSGNTDYCAIGFKHSPEQVGDSIVYRTDLLDDIPDNSIFFFGSAVTRPAGFKLNPETGDLYGQIPYIPAYSIDYKFTVRTVKTDRVTGDTNRSDRVFQLRLQGSVNTDLEWITTSTVGVIKTGYQSELSIKAEHLNYPELGIQYRFIDGDLPAGLEFKSDGSIIGKIPYGGLTDIDLTLDTFSIDGGSTTLDRTYTFTAEATNAYRLATIDQEFKIYIGDNSRTPFSSIYVRPFMHRSKRRTYREFIYNTDIFDYKTLYRPSDPAFGLQTEIKMMLEHGIERLNLAEYIIGLQYYFYNKRFYFGDVKYLPAEDEKGNHVYDIVYLDIIDSNLNILGKSPDSISFLINQQLVDVYTDSVVNWQNSLESISVYGETIKVDEYLRPRFMRTIQQETGSPLGFIKAMPICYVKPNYGFETMRRIQLSGFDFKVLDFEVDRLIIDKTFDYSGDKYLKFPIMNTDKNNVAARPLNVLAGPDGVIITDENGNELLVE